MESRRRAASFPLPTKIGEEEKNDGCCCWQVKGLLHRGIGGDEGIHTQYTFKCRILVSCTTDVNKGTGPQPKSETEN